MPTLVQAEVVIADETGDALADAFAVAEVVGKPVGELAIVLKGAVFPAGSCRPFARSEGVAAAGVEVVLAAVAAVQVDLAASAGGEDRDREAASCWDSWQAHQVLGAEKP